MFDFVNYIYESGISLGLFTLLYFLFLQRETYFRTNRLFLLFALLFSVLLPLLHIRILEAHPVMLNEITVTPYRNLLETVSVYGNQVSSSIVREISTSTYIIAVYLLGVSFFALRLIIRLVQIFRLINQNEIFTEQGMKLVLLDRELTPFSFLSYVFAPKDIKDQQGWEKMLIHELEHVKQGHSFDILVLEVLTVFQWFNPFFWLMKRLLRENHEFLADRAVLAHEETPAFYKKLLLQQFIGPQIQMTNNFNYSLIKKRIQMMSQIKSSKLAHAKLISGLIISAVLIAFFSIENKATASSTRIESTNSQLSVTEAEVPMKTDVSVVETSFSSDADVVKNQDEKPKTDSVKSAGKEDIKEVNVIAYRARKLDLNGNYQRAADDTLTIFIGGKPLEVTGDPSAIEQMQAALSQSGQLKMVRNVQTGSMDLVYTESPKSTKKKHIESEDTIDGEPVFFIVEEMPQFQGGDLGLRKFIANEVRYPKIAQENGIQGKVFVNFVVDKKGKVRNAKVARGVDPSLDAEALRVVSALPDWTPGKQRGQAVAVAYTVPINFALQ